jgi:hypothetical protein
MQDFLTLALQDPLVEPVVGRGELDGKHLLLLGRQPRATCSLVRRSTSGRIRRRSRASVSASPFSTGRA